MGQRLYLGIKYKEQELAAAYYHWSGYTLNAIELLKDVYEFVASSTLSDVHLKAIRALEYTGAGFEKPSTDKLSEVEILKGTRYPNADFKVEVDRNEGILSATSKGMTDLYDSSEECSWFNMADMTFNFCCCCFYDTFEEVQEYFEDKKEEDIPSFDLDLSCLDYEGLNLFRDAISSNDVIKCGAYYVSIIA